MYEGVLLHILLLMLKHEHLHALGLKLSQDVHELSKTVRIVGVLSCLGIDNLYELLQFALLEEVNFFTINYKVYGTPSHPRSCDRQVLLYATSA